MNLPYESAKGGDNAMKEIEKILRRFDCSKFAVAHDWHKRSTAVQFEWRGRRIQLEVSGKGYAAAYLRAHPWNENRHRNEADYKAMALEKGERAVNSILRDWVKGQITAIECGLMPFEHVFMPYMLTADGTRVLDHMTPLLEGPNNDQN